MQEDDDMDLKQWANDHKRKFDLAVAIYRALLVTHAALGVAILVGGAERFPFPTYQPLLDLTDGQVWPWGFSILASAFAMAVQGWWINMIGLGIGLLWMNLFSTMFFAAYKYEQAGSTAPIPYAGLAMIIVALMTYKVVEHAVRRSERRAHAAASREG